MDKKILLPRITTNIQKQKYINYIQLCSKKLQKPYIKTILTARI